MKIRFLLILFSAFLLCSMNMISVDAQTVTIGVNVGDCFKYDLDYNWSSDNQSATIPEDIEQMLLFAWSNISITDISGSIITYTGTACFKNGTEVTNNQPATYDINVGESFSNALFISPNLGANDLALATGDPFLGNLIINETVTKTYPDGTRETNHFSIANENTTNGKTDFASIDLYWDRASGVMVEMSANLTTCENGYTTTMIMSMLLDETNIWEISEFPTWTPMLLAFTALVVVVVIYKQKLTKTPTN